MSVAHQELATRELGKRSIVGTFGHLLMFATMQVIAPGAQVFPLWITTAVFLALIGVRVVARRGALARPERRRRNWTLLAIGSLGCNFLWGIMVVGVQLRTG